MQFDRFSPTVYMEECRIKVGGTISKKKRKKDGGLAVADIIKPKS